METSNKRILIVEDDRKLRALLERHIQQFGFQTYGAGDASSNVAGSRAYAHRCHYSGYHAAKRGWARDMPQSERTKKRCADHFSDGKGR